jgi:hypothetical protein
MPGGDAARIGNGNAGVDAFVGVGGSREVKGVIKTLKIRGNPMPGVEYTTDGLLGGTPVKIACETWLLGLFCTLDMLSTAWLIHKGLAKEANPVMGFYVDRSLPVFVVVKSLMFIAPLTALELLRRRQPRFVQNMLRLGVVAYVLVYSVGILRTNAGMEVVDKRITQITQSLPH